MYGARPEVSGEQPTPQRRVDIPGQGRTVSPMEIVIACALFGAWLAASVASFLCVVAERVPRGESVNGRSHCICGRQLTWWENIPVVSWLALRGVSRCCGSRIPTQYVVAEGLCALAGAAAGALLGASMVSGQWPMAVAGLLLLIACESGMYVRWRKAQ